MPDYTPAATSEVAQHTRVREFLSWIIPINLGSAFFEALAYLVFRDLPTGLTALILFLCTGLLLVARSQADNGQVKAAVVTVFTGLLAADVIIALVQPTIWPTLAVIPLLALMLVLPYVESSLLRRMLNACLAVTLAVTMIGQIVPPLSTPAPWFSATFRTSSLIAVMALIVLLLWQFRGRLMDMLAQTQTAEERYALAAQGANDGLWDWDLTTNQVYFSPRWKAMLGYDKHAVGSDPEEWFKLVHPDDRERVQAELAVHLDGLTPHFESEYRIRGAHGRYTWVLSRGLAVRDAQGVATRIAGSQTDITRRKQIEEQLLEDAFHDALTGLPNRALFLDRLDQAVRRARYQADYQFALLYLDLDRFKVINDSLGHSAGDALLVGLSRRLETCIRAGDTVARLGGDEFTILLDQIQTIEDALSIADRIHQAMQQPFSIERQEIFTEASIGITTSLIGYQHPEDVLRDADTALYRAKALGTVRAVVFDPAMHTLAVTQLQLETDLRRAIERQELSVAYQPIVALATGQLVGFEALVRWQHAERGMIPPAEFIPVAEETGLIVPLGWLVLREACRQMQAWHAAFPEQARLTLSVNISGKQFAAADLIPQVRTVLAETGLDPRCLRLEITESVMMEAAAPATEVLAELRMLDVHLHIDDFGTGYSSLALLHALPIDALKIDRSFVKRLGPNGEHGEIIRAVVTLAQSLGIEVIAEGVETDDQLAAVRALGCAGAQGYLIARPLDPGAATAFITNWNAASEAGTELTHAPLTPAEQRGRFGIPDQTMPSALLPVA